MLANVNPRKTEKSQTGCTILPKAAFCELGKAGNYKNPSYRFLVFPVKWGVEQRQPFDLPWLLHLRRWGSWEAELPVQGSQGNRIL